MDKIKYCIFDVGQVCYPYSLDPLNHYCYDKSQNKNEFNSKGGVKGFDYNPFMKGEISFSKFCQQLCDFALMEYYPDIENEIDKAMHAGVGEMYPETMKVMNFLKHQNIEVCLLSNALPNLANTADRLARKKNIFVSYGLGLLKPDVKIYQKVLQKLGVLPEEVIFVDDKLKNVEAAQSIGIHGIVFKQNTIAQEIASKLKSA